MNENLGKKTKISTLLYLNLNIKLAFSFEKLKHLSKKEVKFFEIIYLFFQKYVCFNQVKKILKFEITLFPIYLISQIRVDSFYNRVPQLKMEFN